MTLVRLAFISILSLLSSDCFARNTSHSGCDPTSIMGKLFAVPDETSEWIAKNFQTQEIKNFNFDLYMKHRDEFENLKSVGQLPESPPTSSFEQKIAWLDSQTESERNLPHVWDVMEKGSEKQKKNLAKWNSRYSKKLTDHEIKEAAAEITLILHQTKFTIGGLIEHGAGPLAEKMVKSQYHQHILESQLKLILNQADYIKKESLLDALKRIKDTSPGKWVIHGGGNAYTFLTAKSWGHALLLSLPDHQWARISIDEIELLLRTGGVDSPHFVSIASKYKGAVQRQAFYNATKVLINQVGRVLLVNYVIKKYHQFQERKMKLKEKDES